MKRRRHHYLITCEHGGNVVPPEYRAWFERHEDLLESHRGWDPGALSLARDLAHVLDAPLFYATVSRLVIDLNRSIGHPRLYSEITREAPATIRKEILTRHYLPYRNRVEQHIAQTLASGDRVVHVSSHSFTPVLDGQARNADIGLLYDPARPTEMALAKLWQVALQVNAPKLRVRRNYPYTGTSDGFTTYLRKRFSAADYLGIELEINQKHVKPDSQSWRNLRERVSSSLQAVLSTADLA